MFPGNFLVSLKLPKMARRYGLLQSFESLGLGSAAVLVTKAGAFFFNGRLGQLTLIGRLLIFYRCP